MASISTAEHAAVPAAFSPARVLAGRLPLALVYAGGAALACLESVGHRTPLVFPDELLYAKFAQSISEGHWLSVWGVAQFFPSFLLPLVQAPVWLLGSVADAYLAARILNALVMASAVFPAYWLAARLVRHRWALVAAAASVAIPELTYHDTLMAEPLAYPLFLLAAGAIVRAVADGTRTMRALAVLACALVAATRLQLAAVVIAYAAAVVVASPRRRAHVLPVALLTVPPLVAWAVWGEGALGQYRGFFHLEYGPRSLAHWAGLVLLLLPFSPGLAVLPGALLRLAGRPRNRAEAAFTTFVGVVGVVMVVQAAMVVAGDARRPMTRYVFYLAPLLVLAFFVYVERGAPRRLLYATLAAGGGLLAFLIPFGSLRPAGGYDADAPAATAFASHGRLAIELCLVALTGIAVSLGIGLVFTRVDHRVTRAALPSERGWINGDVTYLSLPGGSIVTDLEVAFWNRSIRHVARFSRATDGALPFEHASLSADGRLLIDGRPNPAGRYVVGSEVMRLPAGARLP